MVWVEVFRARKWYNISHFMDEFLPLMKPLHTSKNTGMGYSAAYPTGAERIVDEGRAALSSDGRYTSFNYDRANT